MNKNVFVLLFIKIFKFACAYRKKKIPSITSEMLSEQLQYRRSNYDPRSNDRRSNERQSNDQGKDRSND